MECKSKVILKMEEREMSGIGAYGSARQNARVQAPCSAMRCGVRYLPRGSLFLGSESAAHSTEGSSPIGGHCR